MDGRQISPAEQVRRPVADVRKGIEQRHQPGVVPSVTGRELHNDRVDAVVDERVDLGRQSPRERPSP